MDWPVTNRKTDTLKRAMENLAETRSNFSFLVDELQHLTGVLTVRDMITQFAPPCVDSRFTGGGFFESALEQSGDAAFELSNSTTCLLIDYDMHMATLLFVKQMSNHQENQHDPTDSFSFICSTNCSPELSQKPFGIPNYKRSPFPEFTWMKTGHGLPHQCHCSNAWKLLLVKLIQSCL